MQNKNLKMIRYISGSKTRSHSTEGPRMGAGLGKFDSNDSNKRFRQMFTNVKIRKTKI